MDSKGHNTRMVLCDHNGVFFVPLKVWVNSKVLIVPFLSPICTKSFIMNESGCPYEFRTLSDDRHDPIDSIGSLINKRIMPNKTKELSTPLVPFVSYGA